MKKVLVCIFALASISFNSASEKGSLGKRIIAALFRTEKQSIVVTMGPCGVYIPLSDVGHEVSYKNQIVRRKSADQSLQSTLK